MTALDFNQILLTNAESLKPFAISLTRDTEVAKDLYQETLCRALYNKEKYNLGTNIRAWLYIIMRNIYINHYNKNVNQKTLVENASREIKVNLQSPAYQGTTQELSLKEIHQEVHSLPDVFQKPFLLFYEGYKYNEIADMLSEPLGTIKSRIHFARKLLKAQIQRT